MTMPELSGIPGTLPPLLPCPMCGSDKGYTLGTGPTYRWWNMNCNGCGRIVDECASDRRHHFDSKLPDRWPAADEAWNEAGAYAAAAVAMERERLLSVAIARADHEAKAAAHHTGTWYEAHAHHLAAHKAMCDLVDAVWPDRAAAIRGA